MAVIDDIMDQASLTDAIVGPVETEMEASPFIGEQIAPMATTDSQYVSMRVEDLHATGIGQFRAQEGSIPLMDITGREEREEVIELVFLDEGHRISARRWEILNQGGDLFATREARRLVDIGQILERRNERLTEWMRWQAFAGQLTVEYEYRNTALVIDYPIPALNKPFAATAPWTNTAASDPVNDLKVWLQRCSTAAGSPARHIHISDEDAELILTNQNLPDYFNVEAGQPFMPTLEDVLKLLPSNVDFVPTNHAWRDTDVGASTDPADHTRFLPVGNVLITTDYVVDGLPIAETLNGPVEIKTGPDTTDFVPGPQSEIILMGNGIYTRLLRQQSRRMVRLRRPEAFVYADVRY